MKGAGFSVGDSANPKPMPAPSSSAATTTEADFKDETAAAAHEARSAKPFYGDLVRAIAFTGVLPVSIIDVGRTGVCSPEAQENDCRNALLTVLLVGVTWALMWTTYLRHSQAASFVGFLVAVITVSFMDLNQWPYAGESLTSVIFPGVIVGNLFNGALTIRNHAVRMAILFVVASYVALHSPYATFGEDALPLLVPILLALGYLSATRIDIATIDIHKMAKDLDIDWNRWTVRGSKCVLALIYGYHACTELLSATADNEPVSARAAFRTVVKASVVALVGAVSNGTFQREIETNDTLEKLVRERTKTILAKNEQLHMVELALQCSETAIAITDSNAEHHHIVWMNAACERLSLVPTNSEEEETKTNDEDGASRELSSSSHHRQKLLGRPIVEVIALETIVDEKKLRRAFSGKTTQDEIAIREKIFRLEVSPYSSSASSPASSNSTDNSSNNTTNAGSRYLVVLKDITAERAREVAEKTAREEAMLAKAMGDSMVTLTHELRTPMQGIMGVTGMLLQQKEHGKDAVLVESLRLIMASSGLLLNLINNLLDVKKVNSEMMDEFPLSAVTAASSIQDTIDFCQPLASISGVGVVTEFGGDNTMLPYHEYKVVSNSLRLQQVLINLVSNAIKYTSEHSEIRIRIEPTDLADVESRMDRALASSRGNNKEKEKQQRPSVGGNAPVLCFSISDSGPGIAPHQADRLFRRFARLDAQPTRVLGGSRGRAGQPSGTGLGLNLCQLFVQRMHGEIWATNNTKEKCGSTFSFYLPLVVPDPSDLMAAATPAALAKHQPMNHSSSSTKPLYKRSLSLEDLDLCTSQLRVLLVDDVLINRKVIGRMIKLVGVEDVVVADSAEAALELLDASCSWSCGEDDDSHEEIPFDVVITDLQMPGMTGTELSKAIFSSQTYHQQRLPVVVGLTADTSVKVVADCEEAGMSEVLYKPISVVEMRDFFETALPRLRPGVWHNSTATTNNQSSNGTNAVRRRSSTSEEILRAAVQIWNTEDVLHTTTNNSSTTTTTRHRRRRRRSSMGSPMNSPTTSLHKVVRRMSYDGYDDSNHEESSSSGSGSDPLPWSSFETTTTRGKPQQQQQQPPKRGLRARRMGGAGNSNNNSNSIEGIAQ